MSREKELVKKTGIYAVGNLGAKVLSYVMVLVYSYFILPDEMGYYDLIITTVAMIQPLVIFQMIRIHLQQLGQVLSSLF